MTIETVFNISVMIFTVANLAAVGLETYLPAAMRTLRSARFVALTIVWGWVVGPALAYAITRIVPLSEGHAAGLLLISMAPTAPFFPMMVRKARGDMTFAAAFILLATVATVVFLPLLVPLMIKGLTVSTWALAKPLLTMVLLPLIVGLMIRLYAAQLAARLFPVVKRTGGLFTLIVLLLTFLLYYRPMLDAVGSYVIAAEFLLLVGLAVLSYRAGFGLDRGQRSAMSLGMCTRNIAAVFVAYLAIPDPAPGIFVTLALVVPVTLVIASVAARVYAGRPGQGGVAADV